MSDIFKIIIADDHPVLRVGLRQIIEGDPAFSVVAEADNGELALAHVNAFKADILVLDADMPTLDGIGTLREIQRRRLTISTVLLTIHSGEDLLGAAIDLGAKGYILKQSAATEIVDGLKAVAKGHHYFSAPLNSYLLKRLPQAVEPTSEIDAYLCLLTPSERRVLQFIAKGKSSKDIAQELFVHFRTVENHRANICQKLDLKGPNSLIRFATQHLSRL